MRLVVACLCAAVASSAAPGAALAGLSAADRAAINETLDAFVPAAVARRHPERAWPLATSAMHVGGTRAGWARGELPIPPFPAAGNAFHGWTVDAIGPHRADIVLLLHPRQGARTGSVAYDVRLREVGRRWLVDSFVPAAAFAPAGSVSGITAAPDFAPGPSAPPYAKQGRIGADWILVILGGIVGLIVLVPVLVLVVHRRRDRRATRRYESTGRVV
jgi:hypothetical protein